MSSNTKKTMSRRNNKRTAQGRERKRQLKIHGSTPSLDVLLGPLPEETQTPAN